MINRIIFLWNRKLPQRIRNLMINCFPLYLNIKHFIQYRKVDIFERLNLETSSVCNRKCNYCPNVEYERPDKILDFKYIKKIILELKDLNFKGEIAFTGYNEPLMDTRIAGIIKYIRQHLPDNEITIFTNGDFLTPESFEKLNSLNVTFNITLHQIKTDDASTRISSIIKGKKNVNVKRHIENDILSSRCGSIKVRNPEKRSSCILPFLELNIDYNGDILLCCDDYLKTVKWGNIKNDKLINIWSDYEFKRIRKNLRYGRIDLPICKKCLNFNGSSRILRQIDSA